VREPEAEGEKPVRCGKCFRGREAEGGGQVRLFKDRFVVSSLHAETEKRTFCALLVISSPRERRLSGRGEDFSMTSGGKDATTEMYEPSAWGFSGGVDTCHQPSVGDERLSQGKRAESAPPARTMDGG